MKQQVLQKVQAIAAEAKKVKQNTEHEVNAHTTNSLADNIKSEQQAEMFKRLLKAL